MFDRPALQRDRAVHGLLLLTMLVWGLNLSAVKYLASSMDALALATLRTGLAALAMTWFARRGLGALRELGWKDRCLLLACATCMVYANQILMLNGIRLTSATNAALIVALSPLIGMLLGVVALGERPRPAALAGLVIALAGVCLVTLNGPRADLRAGGTGDLWMLMSVICFAVGGAMVHVLARRVDTLSISWSTHVLGTLLLAIHALAAGSPWTTRELPGGLATLLPVLVFSGAVATGLGHLVWNRSLSRLGVGPTTNSLYWVPIFGIGFAVLLLGESLSLVHGAAFACVAAGTYSATRRSI